MPSRRSAMPATGADEEPEWKAALARLQAQLDALVTENGQLRDRIVGVETISTARKELAAVLQAQLEAQFARIEQLESKVHSCHTSVSWRMTRPLRGAAALFKLPFRKRRRSRQPRVGSEDRLSLPLPPAAGEHPLAIAERYITTHPDLETSDPPPLDASVSVIIPTFNAGNELHWLIRKLFAQKGLRSVEVITVDSGSTDGTPALAALLGCKVVEIEQSRFSHSYSRNLGAEHANGDLLLFMVQDAYPIGDHWLYGMARCLLQPKAEDLRLSAVSCAEYSRVDSELLYDVLLQVHYDFLRCGDRDRVGRFTSSDATEVRKQGQLSDIACMIPRAVFKDYPYRGSYAEDLILGIDLIKDGHRVGLLSSIRVVHSHRRGAGYWVRRSFVDVVFLAAIFPDPGMPALNSPTGSLIAAFAIKRAIRSVMPSSQQRPVQALDALIRDLRTLALPAMAVPFEGEGDFGYPPLADWIDRLSRLSVQAERPMSGAEARGARQMQTAFCDRLEGLKGYLSSVYPSLDETVASELNAAIEKTLAMSVGMQLAFCCLSPSATADVAGVDDLVGELKPLLTSGV